MTHMCSDGCLQKAEALFSNVHTTVWCVWLCEWPRCTIWRVKKPKDLKVYESALFLYYRWRSGWVGRRAGLGLLSGGSPTRWGLLYTCMQLNQTDWPPAFSTHTPCACPGSVPRVYAPCVHKSNDNILIALIYWVLNGLVFRLRSVKMEQRKLNDQANSLVDLAKVS